MNPQKIFRFGKYGGVISSIGAFLVLGVGVMILNLAIANRIQKDSLAINLAGRQRMLSQKKVKELLQIQQRLSQKISIESPRDELRKTVDLFDTTLKAFDEGGTVLDGIGQPVRLEPATSPIAQQILADLKVLWPPYTQKLKPILALDRLPTSEEMQDAIDYANRNNLKILGLMNGLTFELQSASNDRANMLRLVQISAVLASIFNFVFILVHFIGRLRTQDEELAKYSQGLENLVEQRTQEIEAQKVRIAGYSQGLEVLVEERTRELRESEEKYRGIFETFPDIYFRTDMLGKILAISPSVNFRTNGYTPKDLEHRPLGFLFAEDAAYDVFYHQLLQQKTMMGYDCEIRCQDGQVRSVSLTARILFKDELPIGFEGTLHDVTQRRVTEAQISHLNVALEQANQNLQQELLERQQAQAVLQVQAQREKTLNRIVKAMRNFLDQDAIFVIATMETAQLLDMERVQILQHLPQRQRWQVVAEYRSNPELSSAMGIEILDQESSVTEHLKQLKSAQIEDINASPKVNAELRTMGSGALMMVPIQVNGVAWGGLCLMKQAGKTCWDDAELELAIAVADHVAICIQQVLLCDQLQLANQQLEWLATIDPLTQVGNRRWFDASLSQAWQYLAEAQKPLAMVLCDVDYFKQYNDAYGHPAGDACLIQVADALRMVTQHLEDTVARYGGEEFALILPMMDVVQVEGLVRQMQHAIAQLNIPHIGSGVSDRITLSYGVAIAQPQSAGSPQHLVMQADRALYQAKQQGRDRVCITSLA
jgi:diguanylate cyclase (GGDEF)-like protein/PAS domain S-box-containing protein